MRLRPLRWLKQPEWLKPWLEPRSTAPVERFVETILRAYLPIGLLLSLVSFPAVILYIREETSLAEVLVSNRWWLLYFGAALLVHGLTLLALDGGKLQL